MKRWRTPLLACTILAANLALNFPLFVPGELPFRGSIEGGYVGMARFVAEYPNPWGWNPFLYCGLPTQFMYVPALPYLTAAGIRLLPQVSPDAVYRTLVALAACLGPVTLFFFALFFTGSRRWAFALALGYSFLSPSYALFPAVEKDRGFVQLPWRMQVLAKYGEGPHVTGLTLLPMVLLAVWQAVKKGGYRRILVAALLLALVPLTNWVAAMSLAIASILLMLAAWKEPGCRLWRIPAAAALAYLLACFWLTPSFVQNIAFNWPVDSFAYQLRLQQVWMIAGVIAGAVFIRALFRFLRGSFYLCFTTLGAFVFGWIATAFYVYGIDTIPESRRYAIEFEFFLALALAEAFRLALRSSNSTVRLSVWGTLGVMLLVGAPQLWAYGRQGWSRWWPVPPESTVEYRLARWIAGHPPQGRVFASGGLRFRLNQWFDIAQVGGGFETGLQNRVPVDLAYAIRTGRDPAQAVRDLEALGAGYLVIHGTNSREYYRDIVRPERIAEALTPVYHVEDDTIYALPPARPMLWTGTGTVTVPGPTRAGGALEVKINADPGWSAVQNGREVSMSTNQNGFIALNPPEAATPVELRYSGTIEQRVMAAISALAWIAAFAALKYGKSSRPFRPESAPGFQSAAHQ